MIPSHRVATHPGIILLKEFLEPMGLSQKAIAAHIGIPVQRINRVVPLDNFMIYKDIIRLDRPD